MEPAQKHEDTEGAAEPLNLLMVSGFHVAPIGGSFCVLAEMAHDISAVSTKPTSSMILHAVTKRYRIRELQNLPRISRSTEVIGNQLASTS